MSVVDRFPLQHLLVGERVHRDILVKKSEKMVAALRIQCAYRSHRTRSMFTRLRRATVDAHEANVSLRQFLFNKKSVRDSLGQTAKASRSNSKDNAGL